jgi:membrane-associated protein
MADAFQTFAEQYAHYGYPVLFVGVLLENAGLPVPGETAVLVAGFLSSSAGGGHFFIGWVILLTVLAAVLGDNLGFWLGREWARPRLQQGKRFLFLTPKTLELAEDYFTRYGLWTIFFARFIAGLRVVGALAAGTAGMPWGRFLVANACGALAWATTMSLLGYFFGHSWELLHHYLGRGAIILLGTAVVLIGLPYLLRRLKKMGGVSWDKFTRGQIVQGLLVAVLEVVCIALLVLMAEGHHATGVDRAIQEWFKKSQDAAWLQSLAFWGNLPASLPVILVLAALLLALWWYQRRSWRDSAALLWAVVASETLGLLVVLLLHINKVEPLRADLWPYGFAGLIPIRAFAVFGMIAHIIWRRDRVHGRNAQAIALILILWSGFGVIWMREPPPDLSWRPQLFTELLLEYATGGLVLFAGIWWLEGFGPGVVVPATPEEPPGTQFTGPQATDAALPAALADREKNQ